MTSNNKLTAKKIIMRRLFKQDTDLILNCYKKYDRLYYNPVNKDFLYDVLLCGEIWGAYSNSTLVACCYFFPLESEFFKRHNTYSYFTDFIDQPEKYMYMGYIGTSFKDLSEEEKEFFKSELSTPNGLYSAFLNIVHTQAFRMGLKYILHSVPLKMSCGLEPMFSCGYSMIKLRGLDNLVVHYIFAKAVFPCENIYYTAPDSEITQIEKNDTKTVSALLESGYCCVDIIKGKNKCVLMCRKLITD